MPIRTGIQQLRFQGDLMLAGWEYLNRFVTEPVALSLAPGADQQRSVITMPGFTGNDATIESLNRFLNSLGYLSEPWGLGRNHGYRSRAYFETQMQTLTTLASHRADETGQPVSLVGHSLGGVYAREVARRNPTLIDRVITLGSPAHLSDNRSTGINPAVRGAYSWSNSKSGTGPSAGRTRMTRDEPPADVPLVSIYSRLDAVVSVGTTRIPDRYLEDENGVPRENIEVTASHMGMTVNSLVLLAVADRLAQPLNAWEPFDAARYLPLPMRLASNAFYPKGDLEKAV